MDRRRLVRSDIKTSGRQEGHRNEIIKISRFNGGFFISGSQVSKLPIQLLIFHRWVFKNLSVVLFII